MIGGTSQFLGFVDVWAAAMLRASWQGAIAIGLVWLVCKGIPRLPPSVRCWLWRLAMLKMLLAALPWGAVDLPVLPRTWAVQQPQVATPLATSAGEAIAASAVRFPSPETVPSNRASDAFSPLPPQVAPDPAASASIITSGSLLFALWLAVFVAFLGMILFRVHTARRGRRTWRLIKDHAILTLGERLAGQLGLFQPPVLFEAESCATPVVFGAMRTAIVLPSGLLAQSSVDQLHLILGHEMAHIRRWDLLGNWFSTLVSGLFFFHPLAWLALRECRLAQEESCDELAVRQPGVSVAEYGRLLVDLATQFRGALLPVVAVGVAESFQHLLKRRLSALKNFGRRSRRVFVLSWMLACVATLCLLPWRLVAQIDSAAKPTMLRSSAGSERKVGPASRTGDHAQSSEQVDPVQADPSAYTITLDRVRRCNASICDVGIVTSGFLMDGENGYQAVKTDVVPFGKIKMNCIQYFAPCEQRRYTPPNLVLELAVRGPKPPAGLQFMCNINGKVRGIDDRGRPVDSADVRSPLRLFINGLDYFPGTNRAAIHLNLPEGKPAAKQLRYIEGELHITEAAISQVKFDETELSQTTMKYSNDVILRLESVRQSSNGIKVTLATSPPSSLLRARTDTERLNGQFNAFGRLHVVMCDSRGIVHSIGTTRKSPNGQEFCDMTVRMSRINLARDAWVSKHESHATDSPEESALTDLWPTIDYHFDPLPDGVRVESIICTIVNCPKPPQSLPFRLENIPLPD
jgi:beta-lactamase regulating signal transducer with metallopeptidase domain